MRLFAAIREIRTDVKRNRLFGLPIKAEPSQRPGVDGLEDAPVWLKDWLKKWLPILADFTIAAFAPRAKLAAIYVEPGLRPRGRRDNRRDWCGQHRKLH